MVYAYAKSISCMIQFFLLFCLPPVVPSAVNRHTQEQKHLETLNVCMYVYAATPDIKKSVSRYNQ